MNRKLAITASILVVAGLLCFADDDPSTELGEAEPAFPNLLDPSGRDIVHITSESFDSLYGYETIEEYVDLEIGKATYTSSSKKGHQTTFIDSTTQTIYRYKPYSCTTLKQSELISAGETGVWSKLVKIYPRGDKDDTSRGRTKQRGLHLYEVAAIWANAADMPKEYSKANVVYSSGKDMFRPAHKWTLNNGPNGKVHLYFIDGTINSKSDPNSNRLTLEMIQDEVDGKIKRTINVLSVDYYIPPDIYETLLQVPLGYGCKPEQIPEEYETRRQLIYAQQREQPNRLRMEATATRMFDATKANSREQDKNSRLTDTISVDLLVKTFEQEEHSSVQMVRLRNSQKDLKMVTDHLMRVQFTIDLRRGNCSLEHATSSQVDQVDKFTIEFNNNLKIQFDSPALMELFNSNQPGKCNLIKITDQGRPVEFLFEECQAEKVFSERPARIMKKYSLKRDEQEQTGGLSLESVTIWILDDQWNANSILESYHFYIVEDDLITDRLELVKLFDISEECYLNNDQMMKYGRDFAWIELTYPLASRDLDLLAKHTHELKETIMQQFRVLSDSLIRMPRVELMFQDTGLIIRLLLLDEPSLIYMWDSYNQMTLVEVAAAAAGNELLHETTVDAEHCADLCRLHGCQAMSYCSNTFTCLLRSSKLDLTTTDTGSSAMKRDSACTVFVVASPSSSGGLSSSSLYYLISRLQHEDLADIELPKMPEELIYSQELTKLSNQELNKKQEEYMKLVQKKLEEQDKFLPTLAMMLSLEGGLIFMIPNKFELDRDPLAEFSLDNSKESLDDDDDNNGDLDIPKQGGQLKAPAFHQGLPLYRYKLSAFRDTKQPLDARHYWGLSYDQCALACTDGRCSSFSYCKHSQDCTITNVYNLEQAKQDGQIAEDSDCFIAQRDFLSKFNEFSNVYRPAVYKKSSAAINPTECAHNCVIETDFNCLAFDYCDGAGSNSNQCYYLDSRIIYTGASTNSDSTQNDGGPVKKAANSETGCSHFSRSYLAEFTRIAYRKVDESQLDKLKTSIFGGHSIDKCAEICLNDLTDCTAFQFCFDSEAKEAKKQQCTMIESRPEGQSVREFRIVQDSDGNIVEQGNYFKTSADCHVFAMRSDTSEAQMRDVALEPLSPAEAKARADKQANKAAGLSLGGALLLYLSTTAIFAAIGCGLVLVRHHNPYVRERLDRLRALFGYY